MNGDWTFSPYVQALRARLAEDIRNGHLKVCPVCNDVLTKSDPHPRGDCDKKIVCRVMRS
ncbi:MAG: hypothetical protein BWY99_02011 [Synergistetes bacterium ADurb.BinA166]|nr:MAG: hypothetical protein BWY99_02011 [Synergistetes bacterium ADurb.BinA166]